MMFKNLVFAFVISMFAFTANAQYLGIKGGLNLSDFNISTDKLNDEKLRTGYHFGAFLQLPLSDGFAIQPEVLYSSRGTLANFRNDETGINGDINIKAEYVDVPILGVIKLTDLAEIHLGPYFGFTSKTRIEQTGLGADNESEFDKDFLKSLDYGLIAGVAVNFGLLNVGARYNFGLQKIENSEIAEIFIGDAINRNFQIYGAIRIGNY